MIDNEIDDIDGIVDDSTDQMVDDIPVVEESADEVAAEDIGLQMSSQMSSDSELSEATEYTEAQFDEKTGEVFEMLAASDVDFVESDEASDETTDEEEALAAADVSGTELDSFVSEEIEDVEFLENDQALSIIESILFSTNKPVSIALIKQAFKGTNVKPKNIRRLIETLMSDYASYTRGITIEEVGGGYQLRTKVDNVDYLKRMIKGRPFKLSVPALEVLSIVAYKQPCIKFHVDEIRGVESGHILRALMDKNLVAFAGRSDLPGKPMFYQSTRKFLEIFGLRNLKELPSLSEIDDLIPEGIGMENEEEKETLSEVSNRLTGSEEVVSYSQGEEELMKISDKLSNINTSTDFFEQEKQRIKNKKIMDKATDIREALDMDEEVSTRDRNWLVRHDEEIAAKAAEAETAKLAAQAEVTEVIEGENLEMSSETNAEVEIEAVDVSEETQKVVDSVRIEKLKALEEANPQLDSQTDTQSDAQADTGLSADTAENSSVKETVEATKDDLAVWLED